MDQLSIHEAVLKWCAQFGLTEDEKGTRKSSRKSTIREQGNTKEREFTRSELFGIFLKTSIWKCLRENIQDFESLSETIRFTRVCEDDEDDGFGQIIPLCRGHTLSRVNPRSRAGRSDYRTSHWSSHREHSWQFWTWNRNSISKQSKTEILCSGIQRKVPIRGRIAYPKCRTLSHQRGITLWTYKRRNFAWRSRRLALGNLLRPLLQVIPAPGNLMRTLSAFLPAQCTCSEKEPFLRRRGSGKLFLPIHRTGEDRLQNGYKIVACSSSLGHDKAETADSVRKHCSTRFLRERLASTHPWRKQQDEVRVLRGFPKFLDLLSSNSRTPWWNDHCAWIDGAHLNSLRLERVCCSFSIQSILENELVVGGKQSKDRQSSSHLSTLSGKSRWRSTPVMTLQSVPKKVHYHCNWKRDQDAVYRVKLSRAQDQGLRFWQTKSRAIIVHYLVPADCNYRVISQKGDRTLFERLSTPRPAPKVILKSNWHSQQQLPLSGDVPSSFGKPVAVETGQRDVKGNTTEDPGLYSSRKPVLNSVPLVDRKSQFEIDLRAEGVSQDAILQDEEQMKEIYKKLESWELDHAQKSIRNELKKKGDMIFSEESSRAIYEMGNLDLIELRQTSATFQCPSCLKHIPEGLGMCLCGVWLRPNQDAMDRIRATFAALKTPYCRTAVTLSRGRKHGHNQWQIDDAKEVDAKKGARRRRNHPCILSQGRTTKYTERLRWRSDGLRPYVKYLDYISSVDIKHEAPHQQRERYESMLFMRSADPNPQAGPSWKREDDEPSANALVSLQKDQGKGIPQIPLHLRTRQHNTLVPTVQHLECLSFNLQQRFSSSSSATWTQNSTWWNSQHWANSQQWRQWQREEWQDQKWWEKWKGQTTTDHVHSSSGIQLRANIVSTVAKVDLSSQFFLCSLAHSSAM